MQAQAYNIIMIKTNMKKKKNPAAVALGRKRWIDVSPEQRSKIGSKAAKARWAKAKKKAL